jgi:acetyl/propionyl-CoA carboxylase alpha subunit
MYRKILIANRGEIAVRLMRACRALGIASAAVYQPVDANSLHVRLADESWQLDSPLGFNDAQALLDLAEYSRADAVHCGIGFLAENDHFALACRQRGMAFIGPPPEMIRRLQHKIDCLETVRRAGYPVVPHFPAFFSGGNGSTYQAVAAAAETLGYPVLIKSFHGGRGRGEHLVTHPAHLEKVLRRVQGESQAVYGDAQVYLEKALLPAHALAVQILADAQGNILHLGEREGSLMHGNQKLLQESPAPCLDQAARQQICQAAVEIFRLFHFPGAASVEFVLDQQGHFYFTEIKGRLQADHPLIELRARLDLAAEQIRLCAGEPLPLSQEQVMLEGHAMLCRIIAEDPLRGYLPSPGIVQHFRLPGGPEVRMDTYLAPGCEIPAIYDSLLGKLSVWAKDRSACLARMQNALDEFQLKGPATNLPVLQYLAHLPAVAAGVYDTSTRPHPEAAEQADQRSLRDLALIAALNYLRQDREAAPFIPERLLSGWHRSSRLLNN